MSLFSEKLKDIIDESGEKVYQLAKLSGVERTTIQKSISGDRVLNLESLEKLIKILTLSPKEKKELYEAYEMTKVGESLYFQRKNVITLINEMSKASNGCVHNYLFNNIELEKYKKSEGIEKFTTDLQIKNLFQLIINEEVNENKESMISLSIPFDYKFIYELLFEIFMNEKYNLKIENVFSIPKNKNCAESKRKSLNVLRQCIPFLVTGKPGFEPYYYYSDKDVKEDITLILPYYLITQKAIVLLSYDFKFAMLVRDINTVETFSEEFKRIISQSHLFFKQLDDKITIYNELSYCKEVKCLMEPLPCIGYFVTKERIESYIYPDHPFREELIQIAIKFYADYFENKRKHISFFSLNALKKFMKDGILREFGTDDCRPLHISERIEFFEMVLENLASDEVLFIGIREEKLDNSGDFELILTSENKILIRSFGGRATILTAAYIDEINTCNIFIDFFEYLRNGNLVYSVFEMTLILKSMIEELKNKI